MLKTLEAQKLLLPPCTPSTQYLRTWEHCSWVLRIWERKIQVMAKGGQGAQLHSISSHIFQDVRLELLPSLWLKPLSLHCHYHWYSLSFLFGLSVICGREHPLPLKPKFKTSFFICHQQNSLLPNRGKSFLSFDTNELLPFIFLCLYFSISYVFLLEWQYLKESLFL